MIRLDTGIGYEKTSYYMSDVGIVRMYCACLRIGVYESVLVTSIRSNDFDM